MAASIGTIQTTIELWHRRHAPEGPDVSRALHIARLFEEDSATPTFLRGIAWHLVREIHDAAGWDIPGNVNLSQCRGAAASLEHATALLHGDIATEVAKSGVPVVVLSPSSAGRAVFGRWDLVSAEGALLVPMVDPTEEDTYFEALPGHRGVRWGSAGSLFGLLEQKTGEVEMSGRTVRIPTPDFVAARTSDCSQDPSDVETVLFCGAAYAANKDGTWNDTPAMARRLDRKKSPYDTALELGITKWLGLPVSPLSGLRTRVSRLFRSLR